MKIISFDGYNFATNGYWASMDAGTARGQWSVFPQIRSRHNAQGTLTGIQVSERIVPIVFGYTGVLTYENAFLRLLGRLDPMNPYPRKLVAQLNNGLSVECMAIVTTPGGVTSENDVNLLRVVFVTTDPYWTDPLKTLGMTATFATSSWTATFTNSGDAYVPADMELTFDKTTTPQNFNYYPVTIANNTDRNFYRELVVIDIGDTRSSAGFAASGDFCNVFLEGQQLPRTLMNYGTQRTYIAVPVTVPAGDSSVLEVVISKTSADSDRITQNGTVQNNALFNGFYTPVLLNADNGTATSGAASTLTDTGKTWPTTASWAGSFVEIVGGTGAGQCRQISSNTATQLTVRRAFITAPDNTSVYCIHSSGWFVDGGRASAAGTGTLTDSSQTWDADSLVGGTVTITAGTGIGQSKTITANTATVLTVSSNFSPALDATSQYVVRKYGFQQYMVNENYTGTVSANPGIRPGGWQISAFRTPPSRVAFGGDSVNAWRRATYLENRDDYSQLSFSKVTPGGLTRYIGILNATRMRGADRRIQEEGTGDGLAITSAVSYTGIRFDYRMQNQNGIGKFVVAAREAGSERWADVVVDSTTRATLTNVAVQYASFTDFGKPTQLYMGVIPADEIEIPTTATTTDKINVRWHETLQLYQDASALTITVAAKETRLRVSGQLTLPTYGSSGTTLVYIGGVGTSATDRETFLNAVSSHSIVVDVATNSVNYKSGSTLTPIPWAIRPTVDGRVSAVWGIFGPGNSSVLGDNFPVNGTLVMNYSKKVFG